MLDWQKGPVSISEGEMTTEVIESNKSSAG